MNSVRGALQQVLALNTEWQTAQVTEYLTLCVIIILNCC